MNELQNAVRLMLTSFLDVNLQWMNKIAGKTWRSLAAKNMSGEQIQQWIASYGHGFDAEIYSNLKITNCKADDYVTFFRGVPEVADLFLRLAVFRQGLIDFSQFLIDIDLDSYNNR